MLAFMILNVENDLCSICADDRLDIVVVAGRAVRNLYISVKEIVFRKGHRLVKRHLVVVINVVTVERERSSVGNRLVAEERVRSLGILAHEVIIGIIVEVGVCRRPVTELLSAVVIHTVMILILR